MTDVAVFVEAERRRIAGALTGDAWQLLQRGDDGGAWQRGDLRVIWSVAVEQDQRPWLHVSVSRPDRLPSYADMTQAKRLFVGWRFAYSVWAAPDQHISIHRNCLHLWAPVDDGPAPLPDFARGGVSI